MSVVGRSQSRGQARSGNQSLAAGSGCAGEGLTLMASDEVKGIAAGIR